MNTPTQPKRFSFPGVRHSLKYRALLTALQNLDNSDAALYAFHDVHGPEYQYVWARSNGGLKLVQRGRICVHRLSSRRGPPCSGYDYGCQPPGNEHGSLWSWKGKPVVYVYQPYGLSGRDIKALVAYCEKMRLDFSIDARLAWHSPGNVLLIELWRKDFDRTQLRNPYLAKDS